MDVRDKYCSRTFSSLPVHPLWESISVPQPCRFLQCPSSRDNFQTNSEIPIFGDSARHLFWQIFSFISVKN